MNSDDVDRERIIEMEWALAGLLAKQDRFDLAAADVLEVCDYDTAELLRRSQRLPVP